MKDDQASDISFNNGLELDESEVTERELSGFYSFNIAAEPYYAISVGVFWPIVLQSLAAANAVQHLDHSLACDTSGAYRCDVQINGNYYDTSTVVLYSTSIAVICQIFVFLTLGSLADHGNQRKSFMVFFSHCTCIIGSCILFVIRESWWWVAFLIYMVAGICFGATFVFYYSFLPILTRYSKEVKDARHDPKISKEEYYKISDKVGNEISSKGFRNGYFVAVVLLFLVCAIVLVGGNGKRLGLPSNYFMQVGIAISLIWQLTYLYARVIPRVKPRPGKPLPRGTNFIVFSISNLSKTFSKAGELSYLFRFLLGWFVYSDCYNTIAGTAILFAQSELGATTIILLMGAILVPLFAGIGNVLWQFIQRKFNLTSKTTLLLQNGLFMFLPIYGLLGFVIPHNIPLGFQNKWEVPVLACYLGLLLGSTQSTCRVLFSELLPHGHEAEFFSLYEMTDKGASWIGPLIVGAITNATGSMRYSFIFLGSALALAWLIFSTIDINVAREQRRLYSEKYDTLEQLKVEEDEHDLHRKSPNESA